MSNNVQRFIFATFFFPDHAMFKWASKLHAKTAVYPEYYTLYQTTP
jgi:hypothetical protein